MNHYRSIKKEKLNKLLIVLLPFLLNSCSFMHRNTIGLFSKDSEGTPQFNYSVDANSTGELKEVLPEVSSDTGNVELRWKIPEQSVEKFVVKFGFSPESLNFRDIVLPNELQTVASSEHGQIYQYELRNIPKDKEVYVALASVSEGKLSEFTTAKKVTQD